MNHCLGKKERELNRVCPSGLKANSDRKQYPICVQCINLVEKLRNTLMPRKEN